MATLFQCSLSAQAIFTDAGAMVAAGTTTRIGKGWGNSEWPVEKPKENEDGKPDKKGPEAMDVDSKGEDKG